LYDLLATNFVELLDFESYPRQLKLKYFESTIDSDKDGKGASMENLLFQLLDSKFFKVYDDVTSRHDLFLKFSLTREKDIIYNFMPLDVKQEYHLFAARVLLQVVNNMENPIPALIYEMGRHFYRGNDLGNAILCHYHKGEFIYGLGANKDALVIFEKAFEIMCTMFRDALHDDLSNGRPHDSTIEDIDNWSMFSRYSLQDMYLVSKASNVILHAMISIIIRYGQCLINCSERRKALSIFPIAIQLFVSSRTTIDESNDMNNNNTILYCKNINEIMHFIKNTKFLIKDSLIEDKDLLNQMPRFGIFAEQFESIFPIISGFLTAAIEPG
jgi:hypothetical protein